MGIHAAAESITTTTTTTMRISATVDGPRNALCQSKSCQRLHNYSNRLYNKTATDRSNGAGA